MPKKTYINSYKGRASADGFLAAFDKRNEAFDKRFHERTMQSYNHLHEKEMLRMKLEAEKERAKYCSCNKKKKNNKKR